MSQGAAWKEAALSGRVLAPRKTRIALAERLVPLLEKLLKVVVLLLFTTGLLAVGVLGTETRLLFYWPGAALLGATAVVATVRWRWRVASPPSEICLAAALLFAAYFAGRCLTSPVTSWAREDLFILVGCGVAYLITVVALSHPRWRSMVFVALILLVVGNLAMGSIHFSGQWNFHVVPYYMHDFGYEGRIRGFFINPNHLAAFLSMMTLFCLGQALFGRSGALWRLLLIFLAMGSVIAVALTKSRGGMIGLGAGGVALAIMGLVMLRRTRPHLFLKAAFGILLLTVLVSLVVWSVMSEQLRERFHGGELQTEGDPRTLIWRSAWAQHLEHPWLGAGSRMFYEGCMRLRTPDAPPWMKDPMFAHNDWLQALSDYGWVGVTLLLVMLAVHLGNGWQYLKWYGLREFHRTASFGSRRLGWAMGCLAALAAALTHAIFEFHFHVPAVALTTAVMLGVLANPGLNGTEHAPRRLPGVRLVSKLALCLCGLTLLCGAWRVGYADYLVETALLRPPDAEVASRVETLSEALRSDPDSASAWHERGLAEISEAGGKSMRQALPFLKTAASDLEMSLQLNPFDGYPALALADVYDVEGRHDDAEKMIRQALRTMPWHVTPRLALARHFHRLRRWMEAEEAYLWASEGRAYTPENWYTEYMGMLNDAEK